MILALNFPSPTFAARFWFLSIRLRAIRLRLCRAVVFNQSLVYLRKDIVDYAFLVQPNFTVRRLTDLHRHFWVEMTPTDAVLSDFLVDVRHKLEHAG